MATEWKECASCHERSWSYCAVGTPKDKDRSAPGAGCHYPAKAKSGHVRNSMLDTARRKLRSGDSPESTEAWLTEQHLMLMRDEVAEAPQARPHAVRTRGGTGGRLAPLLPGGARQGRRSWPNESPTRVRPTGPNHLRILPAHHVRSGGAMTELKPCPFCGEGGAFVMGGDVTEDWVHCDMCSAEGPLCSTASHARVAWNRRTLRDREGLREVVYRLYWGMSHGERDLHEVADAIMAAVEERL